MNRLKELRQEKKLSQKEIALELQIPLRTYQRWENGESQIKPDKAQQLANFFGVSISVLLGYRDESDSLGFRLWSLRNQKGIELEKAASDLKLSVDELKLIEQTDNAELGNALVKDFADYYNVSVGYLLGYAAVDDVMELTTKVMTNQIRLEDISDKNTRKAVSNYIELNKGLEPNQPFATDYSMLNAIEKINDIKLVDEMMTDSMLANRVLDRLRNYMMKSEIIKPGSYNWEIERVMSWLIDFNDELFKRKVSLSGGKISSSPSQNYQNDNLYKTDNES